MTEIDNDRQLLDLIRLELLEIGIDQRDLAEAGQVNILFRDGVEYAIKRIRKVLDQ